ncbi:MAG: hypothetical protein WA555_05705 [Candidatus Sulfotelmatobacter sp.]
MDVGTIVGWTQLALWAVAVFVFIIRVQRGEAKMPVFLKNNLVIGIVIALGICGSLASLYLHYVHPRVVEKVVEKLVPAPCPKQEEPAATPIPNERQSRQGSTIKAPPTAASHKSAAPSPAINQNNSSGINVQQATAGEYSPIVNSPITIGATPKHIAPRDIVQLTDYLSKARAIAALSGLQIVVSADQLSGKEPFPDEFDKMFRDALWPMKLKGVGNVIVIFAPGNKFQGAQIITKGEPIAGDEHVRVAPPDPLYYIGAVLDALKIPTQLDRKQDNEEGVIEIKFEGGFPD